MWGYEEYLPQQLSTNSRHEFECVWPNFNHLQQNKGKKETAQRELVLEAIWMLFVRDKYEQSCYILHSHCWEDIRLHFSHILLEEDSSSVTQPWQNWTHIQRITPLCCTRQSPPKPPPSIWRRARNTGVIFSWVTPIALHQLPDPTDFFFITSEQYNVSDHRICSISYTFWIRPVLSHIHINGERLGLCKPVWNLKTKWMFEKLTCNHNTLWGRTEWFLNKQEAVFLSDYLH